MKEFIKDFIIALIIVLAITAVIKPTVVKEHSMDPTLHENNYLLLYKLAYKTKDHPEVGDIVVFKSELVNNDNGKKKLLIKRVIGVEGDTISIVDGYVYRNGEPLDEPYVAEQGTTYDNQGMEVFEYVVPEDKVFCMGDNREYSRDSRDPLIGPVDEDQIVGKAVIRLYPFDQITKL